LTFPQKYKIAHIHTADLHEHDFEPFLWLNKVTAVQWVGKGERHTNGE